MTPGILLDGVVGDRLGVGVQVLCLRGVDGEAQAHLAVSDERTGPAPSVPQEQILLGMRELAASCQGGALREVQVEVRFGAFGQARGFSLGSEGLDLGSVLLMLTVFVPPEGEILVRFVALGGGYHASFVVNGYEVSNYKVPWEVIEKVASLLGANLLKQEDCAQKP